MKPTKMEDKMSKRLILGIVLLTFLMVGNAYGGDMTTWGSPSFNHLPYSQKILVTTNRGDKLMAKTILQKMECLEINKISSDV